MEGKISHISHIGSTDEGRAQLIMEEALRQQDSNIPIITGEYIIEGVEKNIDKLNFSSVIANVPHSVMMPYINYSDNEINHRKHKETCLKKRKQRKNKKRWK